MWSLFPLFHVYTRLQATQYSVYLSMRNISQFFVQQIGSCSILHNIEALIYLHGTIFIVNISPTCSLNSLFVIIWLGS